MLIDTHAHLHHQELVDRVDDIMASAAEAKVTTIINVGCNGPDSQAAVELAKRYDHVYATVGLHPHEADQLETNRQQLQQLAGEPKVVAIGECGLDYFRSQTQPAEQKASFRFQIELAQAHSLPMVWHVREAFDDFFEIIDAYPGIRGIVHCFTSNQENLKKATARGFLVALNGIMTFTKEESQLEMARMVPLEGLVLETDCPYLAPIPMRGRANEPAYLKYSAEFLASLRGESLADLARATTYNATALFGLT